MSSKYIVLVSFNTDPFEYYISTDNNYADYSNSRNFGVVGRNNINYCVLHDSVSIAQRHIDSLESDILAKYYIIKAEVKNVIEIVEETYR